jgi:WXG100 family type VII secretion target
MDHSGIEEAIGQMQQAASQMYSNLDGLMQELLPLKDGFQGAAATAFHEFVHKVVTNDQQMMQDFNSGSLKLKEMQQAMIEADNRAAGGY